VVNLDDERVAAQAKRARGPTLTFGRSTAADVNLRSVEELGRLGQRLVVRVRDQNATLTLKLVGAHNALNATGALAMGIALGYTLDECARGLEAATAHARRLQIVDAPSGVTVLDDCYNANPASMTAALETLATFAKSGRAIAVLGDMLELGAQEHAAHAEMGPVAVARAQVVVFFGSRMRAAYETAEAIAKERVFHFDDIEALNAFVSAEVRPSDVVLVKGSRGMRMERVVAALTASTSSGGH
jgi:UDP-N-acetylmuramoyl-tripeptide--D-alanyl-D-alanine ligase